MQRTMQKAIDFLFHPPLNAPRATLLLRLMAGGVFFWEGLLKLVYANQGVGRFTKLGIPLPYFSAHFVAALEIGGGLLLLGGLMTRAIAVLSVLVTHTALLSGNPEHQDLPLPGHLAAAAATSAAHRGRVGGVA